MDEQKLIKIINDIYRIEKQVITLNRYASNEAIWEVVYYSGKLQKMTALLDESLNALQILSNLKSTNQDASDQDPIV